MQFSIRVGVSDFAPARGSRMFSTMLKTAPLFLSVDLFLGLNLGLARKLFFVYNIDQRSSMET